MRLAEHKLSQEGICLTSAQDARENHEVFDQLHLVVDFSTFQFQSDVPPRTLEQKSRRIATNVATDATPQEDKESWKNQSPKKKSEALESIALDEKRRESPNSQGGHATKKGLCVTKGELMIKCGASS